MNRPVYPTLPAAYVFQQFANINWGLYPYTNGRHMGIDVGVVSSLPGAPIYAAFSGVVVEAGYSDQGGYGRRVVIAHEHGSYSTLYAHLKDVLVNDGDMVVTGEKIGTMGGNLEDKYRGASGGTHLHFEVILRDAVPNSIRTSRGFCVDPIPYLMNRYYPAPINAIKVTSIKGLRVRSKASVTGSDIIYNLLLKDVVNVAEILPDQGREQWVRLWTLREEYCAIKHDGFENAKFVDPVLPPPVPVPTPEPTPGDEPTPLSYEQGYQAAVGDMQSYLDSIARET